MVTNIRLLTLCFICSANLAVCTSVHSTIIDRVQLLSALPSGGTLTDMISFKDRIYFLYNASTPYGGLWVSNGTDRGTKIIKNMSPETPSLRFVANKMVYPFKWMLADSSKPIILNDHFYFIGGAGELWKSNGTAEGTVRIKTLFNEELYSAAEKFYAAAPLDNILYLSSSYSLWRTDGTTSGTWKVASTGAKSLVAFRGRLFFDGYDSTHSTELWISDGTRAGTKLFKDIKTTSNYYWCGSPENWCEDWGSWPGNFIIYNNELYFSADDGVHGGELWKSDGTPAGTALLADIDPSPGDKVDDRHTASFKDPVVIGNHLIFTGTDGIHGSELWRTDGTNNGTILLKDLEPGPGSSWPLAHFTAEMNGEIYFMASNGLWKTDGTPSGTKMLRRSLDNSSYANSTSLAVLDGRLYFRATIEELSGSNPSGNQELWVTDGAPTGTYQVIDILPGKYENGTSRSSHPSIFVKVGDFILFRAKNPVGQYNRLYKLERALLPIPALIEPFLLDRPALK